MRRYEQLLALARREAELVANGHLDELRAVQDEREHVRAALPETPPAEAKPLLAEALELVRSTEASLKATLAEIGSGLQQVSEGRRAVRAYSRSSISG